MTTAAQRGFSDNGSSTRVQWTMHSEGSVTMGSSTRVQWQRQLNGGFSGQRQLNEGSVTTAAQRGFSGNAAQEGSVPAAQRGFSDKRQLNEGSSDNGRSRGSVQNGLTRVSDGSSTRVQ